MIHPVSQPASQPGTSPRKIGKTLESCRCWSANEKRAAQVGHDMADNYDLLCFDELAISDVTSSQLELSKLADAQAA